MGEKHCCALKIFLPFLYMLSAYIFLFTPTFGNLLNYYPPSPHTRSLVYCLRSSKAFSSSDPQKKCQSLHLFYILYHLHIIDLFNHFTICICNLMVVLTTKVPRVVLHAQEKIKELEDHDKGIRHRH